MNKVILIGNLTRDPEKRTTQNGTSVAAFTVAVQRKFKNADGGYDTDFINCVAWRSTADFVGQYFTKGSKIALTGSLQTRDYTDKNGNKRSTTEVIADDVEFVTKKENATKTENKTSDELDDFLKDWNIKPADDSELPF